MAEKKITCPNCLSDKHCFEEDVNNVENFKSYMCFNCGFTSNTSFKKDSEVLNELLNKSTQLVRDVQFFDYDRKITWIPTTLNMGKLGIIFPEGTKTNWNWKLAEVRKLSPEEQKDPIYEGHEYTLDLENAKTYGQYEFLGACKEMGIIKDL
tara:strand:+ start:137 stop:592 length:456 start_codon:yes stop_codon:yes gene_type:complete